MRIRRNVDRGMREIERRAAGGDPAAQVELLQAQLRSGRFTLLDVLLLAYIGHEPAERWRLERLPARDYQAFVEQHYRAQGGAPVLMHPLGAYYLGRFTEDPPEVAVENLQWLPPEGALTYGATSREDVLSWWLGDLRAFGHQVTIRAVMAVVEGLFNTDQNGLEKHAGMHVCKSLEAVAKLVQGLRPGQQPRGVGPPAPKLIRWHTEMERAADILAGDSAWGQEVEPWACSSAARMVQIVLDPDTYVNVWDQVLADLQDAGNFTPEEAFGQDMILTTVQRGLYSWIMGNDPAVALARSAGPPEWCRNRRDLAVIEDEIDYPGIEYPE